MVARITIALLVALAGSACVSNSNAPIDAERIVAAINAPARTSDDRKQDAARKPQQFLRFLHLSDGDKVAEINAGSGYNARLLATAVGRKGAVYATNAAFVLALFDGINVRLEASVADFSNVWVSTQSNDQLSLPEAVDVAILNNNYHDLHWQGIDTATFNRSVFEALRPGGYFIVGDHSAGKGSGTKHVSSLHRIDRDVVISELEDAGFSLVDSASFLANRDDDRSLGIFAPAIRGQTDRFLLRFQRPR